ncbi:MAG TPA: hypothetical protein VEP50_05590 [bacterium]|nr:hypothetical protein [bacterium]
MTQADLAGGVRVGPVAHQGRGELVRSRADVVVDRRGVPVVLDHTALEFAEPWGGREFWRVVGREVTGPVFAERRAGDTFYLSVDEHRSDGSAELLALIEGRRRSDGGVSLTLYVPEHERETSAVAQLRADGRCGTRRGGISVQLKELVHGLTDLIWTLERDKPQTAEGPILSYVQEAVAVEIEYRRRMRDLDRRLAEIEGVQGVSVSS